jgi:hypothetical protein
MGNGAVGLVSASDPYGSIARHHPYRGEFAS